MGLLSVDKSRFVAVTTARAEPARDTHVRLYLAAPPDAALGFSVFANTWPSDGQASEIRILSAGAYAR